MAILKFSLVSEVSQLESKLKSETKNNSQTMELS